MFPFFFKQSERYKGYKTRTLTRSSKFEKVEHDVMEYEQSKDDIKLSTSRTLGPKNQKQKKKHQEHDSHAPL